jgi:hypothetical protein
MEASYRTEFGRQILARFPGCPPAEAQRIADHACRKYSGRVGRTSAAKHFDPEAIDLAVRAHVRHTHTRYDELLGKGHSRSNARSTIAATTEQVLQRWQTPMPFGGAAGSG